MKYSEQEYLSLCRSFFVNGKLSIRDAHKIASIESWVASGKPEERKQEDIRELTQQERNDSTVRAIERGMRGNYRGD